MAQKKSAKPSPDLSWEERLGFSFQAIAGVDEVGRGCIAGPVVAAAVVPPAQVDFEADPWLREVKDSKLLTELQREALFPQIQSWAQSWAIGEASVAEIDAINIHHAAHLAMTRALAGLESQGRPLVPAHVLVDGKFAPKGLAMPATAIVKGDQKCLSIACASILAKVHRDRYMASCDRLYPGYGFGVHKGYGTPAHLKALGTHGACALHRRSFAPVAQAIQSHAGAKKKGGDWPLSPSNAALPDPFQPDLLESVSFSDP